jgi:hypothetical protein
VCPCVFSWWKKSWFSSQKTKEKAWQVTGPKNERFRQLTHRLLRKGEVDYVLSDSWYASKENRRFVKVDSTMGFIMALKANPLVGCSEWDVAKGIFKPLEEMRLGKCAVPLYLKGVDFVVLVLKKVYGETKVAVARHLVPGHQ